MSGPPGAPPDPEEPFPEVPRARRVPVRAATRLLQAGLLLAGGIGLAGVIASAVVHPNATIDQAISSGSVLPYLSLAGLAEGLVHLAVNAYLTLALLILVATPVARAALIWFHLHRHGDSPVSWMGVAVFFLLVFALLGLAPLLR